jgi:phosphate transport system substrate-binding protein
VKKLLIAIAATIACLPGLTGTASAAGSLTGAGSTLVAPIMSNWIADYKSRAGVDITYGAVGSGAGIAQISARTVDFGASDAPLTPSQAGTCNNCVQIPWALSATGVGFHISGVGRLKLTGPVLAAIYLGQITTWNDPRIQALNKGVRLPNLKITPVFRSDGSGDTYAFTDYLSRVSGTWRSKVGFATSVSFPAGVGGKGNDGITAVVSSTDGAIGYISVSYLIAHGLGAAALKNAAGKFEYPNLKNIQNAARSVKSVPASNELHIVNPSKKYKVAYPLSTFTYVIVPHGSPKKDLLAGFISYVIGAGQKFGAALDFGTLPKVVKNADLRSVRGL